MLHEQRLYFRRRDGKALVLDHLFAPVHDVVKSALIPPRHIAAPIPAIAENFIGSLWRFPVAEHELRTAHHQLAATLGISVVASFVYHTAFSLRSRIADGIRHVQLRLQEA